MMDRAAGAELQRVHETSSHVRTVSTNTSIATVAIGRHPRTNSVNDPGSGGSGHAARLREHLTPEEYTCLADEHALAPEALRAACVRLRAELAAITTYIPATVV